MNKERQKHFLGMLFTMIVGLFLLGCAGAQEDKTPVVTPPGPEIETPATKEEGETEDIQRLLSSFHAIGLSSEVVSYGESSMLNSLYGSQGQYVITLDEEMATLLYYNLDVLNDTALRYRQFIEDNGYDAKTSDPAWISGPFVLSNTYSLLEAGAVKATYEVEKHPRAAEILAVFQGFQE